MNSPFVILPSGTDASRVPDLAFRDNIDDDGEIFLVPYLDGHLLYIPRIGILALLDREIGDALRDDVIRDQLDAAVLTQIAERLSFPSGWKAVLRQIEATPKPWAPVSVTFSNTQKCTLRCRYCYADGGRLDNADIDMDVARAAIDLVVTNAAVTEQKRPRVIFLGEGEATANWEGFCAIIDYFRQQCREKALKPFVSLSTNGVFSHNNIAYVIDNCDDIAFSIDGIAKAHDANRVMPNGRGSFAKVAQTLREFDRRNKDYTIRTTATVDATDTLVEFVSWVGENTRCQFVHVEPVFNMKGLAKTAETTAHPELGRFIEAYRTARRTGARYGIELYFSAADTRLRDSFCGATDATNFLVTSKGLVTSCNEVLRADDRRAALFQYGSWDADEGRFRFNTEVIAKLRRLRVQDIPKCHGCFAKYNCAGDCYAKSTAANGNPWADGYTERCPVTRELLKDNLALALLKQPETLPMWSGESTDGIGSESIGCLGPSGS
jgi:uncharacterized protein